MFQDHSFSNTHTLILEDLSVKSIEIGIDCFNGNSSYEGRRLDSIVMNKLSLKNNGLLQELKIPSGSFSSYKEIEISNLMNLKRIEIEGEKESKSAPFQPSSSFVTNGTPNLEVMKLGSKVCGSGSVFSIDSSMIKEVEIGDGCFQGKERDSKYGGLAQQFVMNDKPELISTKIGKSSFVYFDTYNLKNNPKQLIASVSYSKTVSSFGRRLEEEEDLPSFSGVKEIVMSNLTSLEETSFGKGSFPNVTEVNFSNFTSLQSMLFGEGSFASASSLSAIGYHSLLC